VRELADRAAWDAGMHHAALVVAHASVLTEGLREHATVIFPAESHAEKDGTVVHPDGRVQRLRTAIARPGQVRAGWQVISEVSKRCGLDQRVLTGPMAFKALVDAVPFYAGLTLEQIGGRGVRWPATEAAAAFTAGSSSRRARVASGAPELRNGALRLGRYRPIWASPEVDVSPALRFTVAEQLVELAPEDAERLGIAPGAAVTVAQNGTRLHGRAAIRTGVPQGTAFLAEGIASDSANQLTEPSIEVSAQ
jgi:NADH-quinone oxidoreductase subunit G